MMVYDQHGTEVGTVEWVHRRLSPEDREYG
jgi:hypothetical protein